MTAKFLTAALLVAALGCARGAASTPPAVAHSRAPLTKTTPATHTNVATQGPRELRPLGIAQTMHPLGSDPAQVMVNKTKEGGVGITGPEKTYLERVDNSGWSGRSPDLVPDPPSAIGGGPASEALTPSNAPSSDEDQKPAAALVP